MLSKQPFQRRILIAFVLMQGFKLLERWLRVDACQGR